MAFFIHNCCVVLTFLRNWSKITDMTLNWLNKVILIAEDEPANYLFVEKVFNPTQIKIIRAHDGSEAIDLVKNNPAIDIVLMDIYMPNIDGFEATKVIKSIKPQLPVIAQTCYDGDIDYKLIEEAGFDNFIRKPININKLLAIVAKYLSPGFMLSANVN